jgi:nucleotide-binding universal stress UspA family protein
LTIFTVVEPPIQSGYYYAASGAIYLPSFIDEQYEKATEEATRVVRDYQSLAEEQFENKLKCEMIVGRGEVRDEIVDFAEASKADLLIVGSRGFGTLKRTFVGSTSDYCVHHVHCPIIVVKSPHQDD